MHKCRITVMKQTCYPDLMAQYENPLEHACDMEVGQVYIANGWKKLNETNGIYYKKVGANQTNSAVDYPVFAEFTVAGTADITGYETAEINVTAYAVQSDGFNTAWAAWSAGGFE